VEPQHTDRLPGDDGAAGGHRVVGYEPFATGWLADNGHVAGRPVDVLVMPDGALLVSDDHAGAIYRITYRAAR